MQILLANPRGFCAGVDRAITIVERALEIFEPPIYVRHEVVHNKYVVNKLRDAGAIFVEELHVESSGLSVFECDIRHNDRVVAQARLNVYQPPDETAFIEENYG